jgi:inosine/xanthosine triphosphate pyrophosphatase family protein
VVTQEKIQEVNNLIKEAKIEVVAVEEEAVAVVEQEEEETETHDLVASLIVLSTIIIIITVEMVAMYYPAKPTPKIGLH